MALAFFIILLPLCGEGQVALPSLNTLGSAPVKVLLFSPIPVCLGILYCLDRRLPATEAVAARPVPLMDQAAVVVVCLTGLAGCALIATTAGLPMAWAAGRNLLFLTGLALVVRAVLGSAAGGSAAVGWLVLTTLLGYGDGLQPQIWTIVLRGGTDVVAASAACLMCAGGIVALGVQSWGGRSMSAPTQRT